MDHGWMDACVPTSTETAFKALCLSLLSCKSSFTTIFCSSRGTHIPLLVRSRTEACRARGNV